MSLYVEILMQTDMKSLWERTQNPALHAQWDLRFSSIEYLPRPDESQPQKFLYSKKIGFGMTIRGEGETVGSREDGKGRRSSALKFSSDDCRSLIQAGSGYWQYVPTPEGLRFLTEYDYQTRFGSVGRLFDRFVFRPLVGWATAWSFDRLRLWLEKGIDPRLSLERSAVHCAARLTLAFIWIYQGVFPKLLFHDSGELSILQHTRMAVGLESTILTSVGVAEIFFGVLLLLLWRSRNLLLLNVALLALLGVGAAVSQPSLLVAPFNPVTLNLTMGVLGAIGWLSANDLPSAVNCLRKRREKQL